MSTKIPYCDEVLEVSGGCTKCSPGCQHCWAIKEVWRMSHNPLLGDKWQGLVEKTETGYNWTGKIKFFPDALDIPLQRKKPTTYFIDSKSDLFHPEVLVGWTCHVFDMIEQCPQHTFLILTKRPALMEKHLYGRWGNGGGSTWQYMSRDTIMPNLHIGVSISTQAEADEKIPILLQIPAAKRFVSLEPMLEKIDMSSSPTNVYCEACTGPHDCNWEGDESEVMPLLEGDDGDDMEHVGLCPKCGSEASYGPSSSKILLDGISQIIVGAESINGRPGRECKIEYVRAVVKQCKAAGVKIFVKQVHMWKFGDRLFETEEEASFYHKLSYGSGNLPKLVLIKDISKFPEDLQIQETI